MPLTLSSEYQLLFPKSLLGLTPLDHSVPLVSSQHSPCCSCPTDRPSHVASVMEVRIVLL